MRQVKSRPDHRDSAAIDARLLQNSSVAVVLAVAVDGHIMWANDRLHDLLGATVPGALIGRKLTELLVDPADWQAWRDVPATGRAIQLDLRTAGGGVQTLRGDLYSAGEGPGRIVSGLFVQWTSSRICAPWRNARRGWKRSVASRPASRTTSTTC